MVGWHLMEVFTIAFCYPSAPVKEHPPRRIGNRLGEVSVLYHIARFKFLGNNGIKTSVVKKVIRCFCEKVKTLASNNIGLFCQSVFRLIPPFAPIRLARKVAVKFHKFAFCLSVKARIGYLFTVRSRQKIVCANIDTTSRLNTFQRIRHIANDKEYQPRAVFFNVTSFGSPMSGRCWRNFHFTEFRHFQAYRVPVSRIGFWNTFIA